MTMDFDQVRIGDISRFVTDLEDELRAVRPGAAVPGLDSIEGTDPSRTVYCLVTLAGVVTQVGITDGWWPKVGPQGVATAVLQARQTAREKAAGAKLLLQKRGLPLPARAPAVFEVEPAPPEEDLHARLAASKRKMERAAESMRRSKELGELVFGTEKREVAGPRGLFVVQAVGIRVVGASVRTDRLRPEDGNLIADDAREAFLAVRAPVDNLGGR